MRHSAVMGGSTAKRRIHCTGSAVMEANAPAEPPSKDAARGTDLHDVLDLALKDPAWAPDLTKVDYDVIQFSVPQASGPPRTVSITRDDFTEALVPAYEAVQEVLQQFDVVEYDTEVEAEHTRTCDSTVFGTADIVGRCEDGSFLIIDLKFGSGVMVSARENYQLAFYTTGLMDQNDPLVEGANTFHFVIVQPAKQAGIIDTWTTDLKWMHAYQEQERLAFQRIQEKSTALNPGEWCRFCKARPACPTQHQLVESFAKDPQLVQLGSLSGVQWAKVLDAAEQAAEAAKAVKSGAFKFASQGGDIPGWKLKDSFGHRAFNDPDAAEALAIGAIGSAAVTKKLKSPAQLSKEFKRLSADFKPLENLIERPLRGQSLVRDSDTSPAAMPGDTRIELPMELDSLKKR